MLSRQHDFVFFSISVQMYMCEYKIGRELNLTRVIFAQANIKMKERTRELGGMQEIES